MAPNKSGKRNKSSDHEKQKERQRKAMRKLRAERRNNPLEYEEQKRKDRVRYQQKKQEGRIKTIEEMTEREKRLQRKEWRKRSKESYQKRKRQRNLEQRLNENTPPPTPEPEENLFVGLPNENDGRVLRGRLRRRQKNKEMREENNKLKTLLANEKKKKNKYRMKYQRLKKAQIKEINSPKKNVERLIQEEAICVTPNVKRKLLFSEVIAKQLSENYKRLRKPKEKRMFWKYVSGSTVSKYKTKCSLKKLTSSFIKEKSNNNTKKERLRKYIKMKNKVVAFLERDDCSRLCPGKKDFIKRNKEKKQKRLLNESLKALHKKYVSSQNNISYASFCRMRPFWVVQPNVNKRDTCLCVLHSNVSLMTNKLKIANVITENSIQDICNSLCCQSTELKENCLERNCNLCKSKVINAVSEFGRSDTLIYEKWCTKKVPVVVKGVQKTCLKTVKEKIITTKGDLLTLLQNSVPSLFSHIRNINHQFKAIREIKNKMKINEVLIHMDFSENYICKYTEEVQSAHFGGSKPQLSLHTVVVYFKVGDILKRKCYCTVSENLRHDPAAICCHLNPIFKHIKQLVPGIETVNFLSDGPSTQYRNRKMFNLIGTYLPEVLNIKSIRWHYTEKGHGKGAPDGVGGCLKRTADVVVARGKDISNFDSFVNILKEQCPGIKIFGIKLDESELFSIENNIPKNLPTFRGTLQCHEVVWSKNNSFLDIRKLTCLLCKPNSICQHYSLGKYKIVHSKSALSHRSRLHYEEVYSDEDDDDEQPLKTSNSSENLNPKENDYVVVVFNIPGKSAKMQTTSYGFSEECLIQKNLFFL